MTIFRGAPNPLSRLPSWSPSRFSMRGEERATAALFLLPTLALIGFLLVFPTLLAVILTVTGRGDGFWWFGDWVGGDNWDKVVPQFSGDAPYIDSGDRVFTRAFIQTGQYILPSVVITLVLALGVALVLNQAFRGRLLVRASLLIPWAIPPVVVAAMFQWFLDPRRGIFPYLLREFGIADDLGWLGIAVNDGTISFFDDRWLPGWFPFNGLMATFVGIHVWKTFPLIAIIFLVALQYLPQDLDHAARIDGAGWWRRFRYVVLPHLWPTIIAAAIIQFLLTAMLFDVIFALGSGGVKESTTNLIVYAYRQSFFLNNLGYGAVLAFVISGIVVVFALVLTRGRVRTPL